MPYFILLIGVGISPTVSMTMTRYLLYKHKIDNIGDQRFPKNALKFFKSTYSSSGVGIKMPLLG